MPGSRLARIIAVLFGISIVLGGLAIVSFKSAAAPLDTEAQRTLIRNASLVLTMDPAVGAGPLGVLEQADILLDGERIVAVGKDLDEHNATVIDASGRIVMPGFVDTHNHLWQSLIRGCGTDEDVKGWLADCVFPFSPSPISEADAYTGVRLSTLDLISTGVTTVVDWSHAYTPDFVSGDIRALNESGLRFVFAYFVKTSTSVIEDIRRVKRESIDPNPRATLQVAGHPSSFFFKDLRTMVDLSRELGVMMNVHLLENIGDRADDPIRLLQEADALGPNLMVNHAVHLTGDEIATLAAHHARVAHSPLSNMRLASGIMLLPEMHAAGLRVGLGLDGGTNDTSDMFNNMRAAVGLQRAKSLDAKVFPTVSDVLRMATIGGAEVLGMDHKIGSLTPGKKADLIILNPETLNFAPRFDWASQIVFNAQPRNVEWVFVDGQPLMRKGKLVGSHPEKTIEDAEDAVDRIRAILHL